MADPSLRARLTPTYEIGCKRILVSNDYLPALTRPNVELVTEAAEAAASAGREVATSTDAAALLGLPRTIAHR